MTLDTNNFDFLCKYVSGSRLYGINTNKSDKDIRGVYIDNKTDIESFIYLVNSENPIDEKYLSLKKYLNEVKNGNFYCIEALFNKVWLLETKQWQKLQLYKYKLLDKKNIYNWTIDYYNQEIDWAQNKNTDNFLQSSKTLEKIKKYGYNHSCITCCLNVLWQTTTFFNENNYFLNIKEKDNELANFLINIKTNPLNYKLEYLLECCKEYKNNLNTSFSSTQYQELQRGSYTIT